MSEIVVIYDGQCELCRNSITWIKKKLLITALDFHTAELSQFGLSKEQCSREVFVTYEQSQYRGAQAVSFLLNRRGNKNLSGLIKATGPVSRATYKWVANNRNSFPVKILAILISRAMR